MNTILEKIEEPSSWMMVKLAKENNALNFARSTLNLGTPEELKRNAKEAIEGNLNGYTIPEGRSDIREAISERLREETEITFDPENEIIITCGGSEGFISSMLSLVEGENGVVIPEPFYENYLPVTKISRGKPVFLSLNEPDYTFHKTDIKKLPNFTVFILNNPHNPTGKVYNEKEVNLIGEAVIDRDAFIILDETYRDYVYKDKFYSPLNNPDLVDKTILIGDLSVSLGVRGWRLGFVAAREGIMDSIKKVHSCITMSAPSPFQWAFANLDLTLKTTDEIRENYKRKRDFFCQVLKKAGFNIFVPEGGYYIMCNFEELWEGTDWGFAKYLMKNKNIAVVPGSAFFFNKERGKNKVRFSFSQPDAILEEAAEILKSGVV